ncbi:MAG: alpha/beta hydrolase [Clostridia bacterium]|nr:alpha/beta hydrolase [Clostridia bacterium]
MRSAARAAHYRAFKDAHPTYRGGPATYSWLDEARGVTKTLLSSGAPEGIAIPVRLYAAEHDRLVQSAPQKEFIARVQQGEYILVRGAEHEIFGAVDAVSHPFFESVLDFFEA